MSLFVNGEKPKRRRDPNLLETEKILLVDLVSKYINILENKKTNSITISLKNKAWIKLTSEFNAQSTNILKYPRTKAVLKCCWNNLKKRTGRIISQQGLEVSLNTEKQDPVFAKVKRLIQLGAEGLENSCDNPILDNIDEVEENKDNSATLQTVAKTSQDLEEPGMEQIQINLETIGDGVQDICFKTEREFELEVDNKSLEIEIQEDENSKVLQTEFDRAVERHLIVLEIYQEKLKQEKIKTKILQEKLTILMRKRIFGYN